MRVRRAAGGAAYGMGCVRNHDYAMPVANFTQRADIDRLPRQVNRQHSLDLFTRILFDHSQRIFGTHQARLRIDIGEQHVRAAIAHGIRRRQKGHGRNDRIIARAEPLLNCMTNS